MSMVKQKVYTFELFLVYFFLETVFLNSIQIVTAIIRNDVYVSRIQSNIILVVVPLVCLLLLLFFAEDPIPPFFHKLSHLLCGLFNLLLCVILLFSGWLADNISLDAQISIWFLSLSFTSISFFVSYRYPINFEIRWERGDTVKKLLPILQLLIPIGFAIGFLGLLKFPGFYCGISACIHMLFFGFLFIQESQPPMVEKSNLEFKKAQDISSIEILKIIRNIIKYIFFFISLLLGGMIWADRWKIAASPEFFFPIMYRLLISPFLYMGIGLYILFSWLSRVRERNYGLLVVGPLVLLSLMGVTILSPITLGYATLYLLHQTTKFRFNMMKLIFILFYQIGFFGSYLMLLAKWTIPWVTDLISGIQTSLLWTIGILLFLTLFLNELSRNLVERKEVINSA